MTAAGSALRSGAEPTPQVRAGARAPITHLQCAGYGVGSIGTATFVIIPQLYLLYFMTEVLAIPAAAAGLVMLLPKIWEFVTDPLVGAWSDRLHTRWGRRRPMMAVGAALFLVFFVLLWSPPQLDGWPARAALMLAAYIAVTSAYTLYAVPYIAVPAESLDDEADRVRIVAWRMAFVSVGILLAGGGAPLLVEAWGGGRDAFAAMGWIVGALCCLSMLAAVALIGRLPVRSRMPNDASGLGADARAAWSNRGFRLLWIAYVLQLVATAVNLAMLPYFAKYLLQSGESLVTSAFVLLTVASVVALPLFAWVARRIGKLRALVLASVAYGLAMAALHLVPTAAQPLALFHALFLVVGVANAGQMLLPFAMLTDLIEGDRRASGIPREGVFTGLWIAGEKLGLALGGAFAGLVLSAAGFVESSGSATVTQTPQALQTVLLLVGVVPGLIFLASLAPLQRLNRRTAGQPHPT